MKKAGGIIALIAGIFAVVAALFTLLIGGAGAAFEAKDAQTVIMLGWGGVAFSFLTIVLGAICMGATSRWPGVLLIVCALGGIVLGGALVALFMALALIGGVLALFGRKVAITAGVAAICASSLSLPHPGSASAQDLKSMQLAHELGSVISAEAPCGLTYDQAAISAFIEKRVRADDMAFSGQLRVQTSGQEFQMKNMSASAKTAHCTQARRVAKSYGFIK